jgi:hypothetical protein
MTRIALIFCLATLMFGPFRLLSQNSAEQVKFDFCGRQFEFSIAEGKHWNGKDLLSQAGATEYYNTVLNGRYQQVVQSLIEYRKRVSPDDWLFYQLIRRTAQNISPKEKDYLQYTLHKWYFLTMCGYDAMLATSGKKLLFYVQCDENIYNVPFRTEIGKQYVCLNFHDYKNVDFLKEKFLKLDLDSPVPQQVFSYKVTNIPEFRATEYLEKDLHFSYYENDYHFKVRLSPQVQKLFQNYPVVDYDSYLNIPMSRETYNSLIPQLKKTVKGMSEKNGVDYLMRFTRYAFLFEADTKNFGSEKRLSPEQTLFYDQSDCEDRVALFFFLVKEIYNLPMIVLAYPTHVTVAVEFAKPVGHPITYKGRKYSVCEPTPQAEDLQVGQMPSALTKAPYEVAYVYQPKK